MKTKTKRAWGRIIGISLVALALVVIVGGLTLRRRLPRELMQDIRAGIAARNIQDPDARLNKYLEVRYGTQSDPANRRKVFLDFFNLDHIKAMQMMVRHSPSDQKQANVLAMSRWVESFRNSLQPEDRAALSAQLQSDAGRVMLGRATAQYNCQDVYYRGLTAPVISQLLTTIAELQPR